LKKVFWAISARSALAPQHLEELDAGTQNPNPNFELAALSPREIRTPALNFVPVQNHGEPPADPSISHNYIEVQVYSDVQ